jgi:hypothetical protein
MRLSTQCTSEQLIEIIQDEMNLDKSASEVQKQVENGGEVLDTENTSSILKTVLNIINNEFEHECLGKAVRLLNARPIR